MSRHGAALLLVRLQNRICTLDETLRGTGEGLTLVDPEGVERATVTIVGEFDAQRIHARLATAVTPGTYRLRLVTHGYGTPDANLVTLAKKVTVKE